MPFRPTTEQVNEVIYQVARQRYLGDKQDEEFHQDPRKKAKLRSKRQTDDIREGTHGLLITYNLSENVLLPFNGGLKCRQSRVPVYERNRNCAYMLCEVLVSSRLFQNDVHRAIRKATGK